MFSSELEAEMAVPNEATPPLSRRVRHELQRAVEDRLRFEQQFSASPLPRLAAQQQQQQPAQQPVAGSPQATLLAVRALEPPGSERRSYVASDSEVVSFDEDHEPASPTSAAQPRQPQQQQPQQQQPQRAAVSAIARGGAVADEEDGGIAEEIVAAEESVDAERIHAIDELLDSSISFSAAGVMPPAAQQPQPPQPSQPESAKTPTRVAPAPAPAVVPAPAQRATDAEEVRSRAMNVRLTFVRVSRGAARSLRTTTRTASATRTRRRSPCRPRAPLRSPQSLRRWLRQLTRPSSPWWRWSPLRPPSRTARPWPSARQPPRP